MESRKSDYTNNVTRFVGDRCGDGDFPCFAGESRLAGDLFFLDGDLFFSLPIEFSPSDRDRFLSSFSGESTRCK